MFDFSYSIFVNDHVDIMKNVSGWWTKLACKSKQKPTILSIDVEGKRTWYSCRNAIGMPCTFLSRKLEKQAYYSSAKARKYFSFPNVMQRLKARQTWQIRGSRADDTPCPWGVVARSNLASSQLRRLFAAMRHAEPIGGCNFPSRDILFFFLVRSFLVADGGWRHNWKAGFPTIQQWSYSEGRLQSYELLSRAQIIDFSALHTRHYRLFNKLFRTFRGVLQAL